MNHNFGKVLVCATLFSVAIPAEAGTINWAFGENVSIEPFGPAAIGIATGSYTSQDGYLGQPTAGINSTLTAPGSTLTYSPVMAPAGLSSVALNDSSYGSTMNTSASMQSGTTHMFASSVAFTIANGAETHLASTIQFQDMLTFSVAGGGSDTIGVGFALDGNVQGDNYSMVTQENFGTGLMYWDAGADVGPFTSPTTGWNTFSFTGNSVTGFNFLGTLTVTNGEAVPVLLLQQLSCETGTICDFSNTGQMSLALPSDVTYSSASGVFLTQTAAAPEPSSLALMGLGIAGVLRIRRRRAAR